MRWCTMFCRDPLPCGHPEPERDGEGGKQQPRGNEAGIFHEAAYAVPVAPSSLMKCVTWL